MKVDRKEDDGPIGGCGGENSEGQKRRLAGIESVGELEPSYPLIGLVYQMSEDGQLRYIRWEQATKRDQELMGVKVGWSWGMGFHQHLGLTFKLVEIHQSRLVNWQTPPFQGRTEA